jgi:hypothetical protein
MLTGTCGGGGQTTLVLEHEASEEDGVYEGLHVVLTEGVGAGQCSRIYGYTGTQCLLQLCCSSVAAHRRRRHRPMLPHLRTHRYAVYLLYSYKYTNTDAEDAPRGQAAIVPFYFCTSKASKLSTCQAATGRSTSCVLICTFALAKQVN